MKRTVEITLGILSLVALILGVLAVSTQIPPAWHGWIALAASIVAVVQAAIPRVFVPTSGPVPVVAIEAKGNG